MEFQLANEDQSVIETNSGHNYVVEGSGRYVVEAGIGIRKVGEADIVECLRTLRPNDRYLELYFQSSPIWRRCYVKYSLHEKSNWEITPMEMQSSTNRYWFHRIEILSGVQCAFSDGGDDWDNNDTKNYSFYLPGKYIVANKMITYLGQSDLDAHRL